MSEGAYDIYGTIIAELDAIIKELDRIADALEAKNNESKA